MRAHHSARRLLSSHTGQRDAARALLERGIKAKQSENLDEAISLLTQSRSQWHLAKDQKGEAESIKELGEVMRMKGNRSSYLSHLITYKQLVEPFVLGEKGAASLELQLGIGYYNQGDLPAALERLESARVYAAAEKNVLLEARALLFVARVKKEPELAVLAIEKFATYGDKHILEQQRAICVLAEIHEGKNDLDAALEALRAARNVSEGKDKAQVYRWAANIFLKKGDGKSDREAMTCLKTALSIADGAGDKLGVISSSFQLGNLIDSMIVDSQEPLPYWKQALVTILEVKEKDTKQGGSLLPMESAVLNRLTDHFVKTRQLAPAVMYATQLAALLRDVVPLQAYSLLSSLKTLADLHAQSGDMSRASEIWSEAERLGVKDTRVTIGKASSLWHLGKRQEARSIASRIPSGSTPAPLLGDLALLLARTGELEAAHQLAERVPKDHQGTLQAGCALALVAAGAGRHEEAKRLAGKTLAAAVRVQSYPMMLESLQNTAEAQLHLRDTEGARGTAEKMMRLAGSYGDKLTQARAASLIGRAHEAEGGVNEAIKYYKSAVSLFHSSGNRRGAFLALSQIQTIYENQGLASKVKKTQKKAVKEATDKD